MTLDGWRRQKSRLFALNNFNGHFLWIPGNGNDVGCEMRQVFAYINAKDRCLADMEELLFFFDSMGVDSKRSL